MQFAPFYPLIYQLLHRCFPQCIWHGDLTRPQVALTFDDGPHPQHTPALLETLASWNVKASFFLLGHWAERSPTLVQCIHHQHHSIGLHGYSHRNFPCLTPMQLQQDLDRTRTILAQACHLDQEQARQQIRHVRPPNGVFLPQTLRHLLAWHYQPVMWSVVPEDWTRPGVTIVVQRVLRQVRNGSLIVLHDGPCGGADVAATVNHLVPALLERGYEFVTLDDWSHV